MRTERESFAGGDPGWIRTSDLQLRRLSGTPMIAITDDTFDGPKMSENRALLTLRTGTRPSILSRRQSHPLRADRLHDRLRSTLASDAQAALLALGLKPPDVEASRP